MIKSFQLYQRHSVVPLEPVLSAIQASVESIAAKKKPLKVVINGETVNAKSLRLQTFLRKGLVCAKCGCKGTHFALERSEGQNAYHLNLWSTDENGDEVLMTHDHILARSLGGADDLSNTQTMCSPCNAEKAIGEYQQHKELIGK